MTAVAEPEDLLKSTGYLIARAGSESRRQFVEALAGQDLTLSAYSVLMILGGAGTATQREIGLAAGIDPRNLVPILDDLESRRLIVRDQHPADRRRHSVALSTAGRAKLSRLVKAGDAVETAFLQRLSPAERRQLHRLLRKLLGLKHR